MAQRVAGSGDPTRAGRGPQGWRNSPRLRPLMRRQRLLRRRAAELAASAVDWIFDRRALAWLLRRDHVLCLGDSHVEALARVRVPRVWFRAHAIRGATASGLENPQSKSQARATMDACLRRAPRWQEVMLQLGEVDCGFLIWHRARRLELTVEQQLAYTLDTYAGFLASIVDSGFKRVLVLSVPLPTIGDDPSKWGEIANLRRTVSASQSERTALTLRFNDGLRERCTAVGATFVDATTGHLDPSTGLLDTRFLRDTHQDHHLADDPYSAQIARELRELWP